MADYIVVGLGLAGIAFCKTLEKAGRPFLVFDPGRSSASTVASGLYNPVVLKHLTPVWKGEEFLEFSQPFYRELEREFGLKLDHPSPVLRVFHSPAEQNQWHEASERPALQSFLSPEVVPNANPAIRAPFGFGKVNHTGRIDTGLLISAYRAYLKKTGRLREEVFDHKVDIKTKKVVFTEGTRLTSNPFFKHLPLVKNKGELLTVKAPDLALENILNASVFVIPLGGDRYRVGATYNWRDTTVEPTPQGREELENKLKKVISCPYEVVDHRAGVRPTVKDRRPLVGVHHEYKNLAVLNGLGSRGVLSAPWLADTLYRHIEHGEVLPKEIDCNRFR